MKIYTPLFCSYLRYCIYTAVLFLITFMSADARERLVVSGKVLCKEEGGTINFATVYFKDTHFGSMTAEDGSWTIEAPAGDYTLVVSAVGYRQTERKVRLSGGTAGDSQRGLPP